MTSKIIVLLQLKKGLVVGGRLPSLSSAAQAMTRGQIGGRGEVLDQPKTWAGVGHDMTRANRTLVRGLGGRIISLPPRRGTWTGRPRHARVSGGCRLRRQTNRQGTWIVGSVHWPVLSGVTQCRVGASQSKVFTGSMPG
ncbi:hypothetical protein PoB_006669900 [Plakobranchus ocellatus]|uniref:Secreted protein n=1 Tax=Plakobranchus ocellatus TaxID=259542 RepID=A0AAV4D7L3_9GAST|nr:hypothetical protein PoB_006669900 [Plakobranchus ocellatus]